VGLSDRHHERRKGCADLFVSSRADIVGARPASRAI
jgi:hypothetical protein